MVYFNKDFNDLLIFIIMHIRLITTFLLRYKKLFLISSSLSFFEYLNANKFYKKHFFTQIELFDASINLLFRYFFITLRRMVLDSFF